MESFVFGYMSADSAYGSRDMDMGSWGSWMMSGSGYDSFDMSGSWISGEDRAAIMSGSWTSGSWMSGSWMSA